MQRIATQETRPWARPFWKPARGKIGVFAFLLLVHSLSVVGLFFFPFPTWKILGLSLLFAGLGGLGTTVCYHRLLAHRTLKLNSFVEHVLIFFAIFNGSGTPASWVAYHRHHHSQTDGPENVSSPKQGGFWWAHLRWLYQSAPADLARWCPELNVGMYRFWSLAEVSIVAFALLFGLVFGWQGFFWLGAIRLVYSLHMQCLVNSLTHLGDAEDGDSSQNVWWLGPLQLTGWGENWHKNHHTYAGSARLGLHWWQPDIGWYFIYVLERVGLATAVKRPRIR